MHALAINRTPARFARVRRYARARHPDLPSERYIRLLPVTRAGTPTLIVLAFRVFTPLAIERLVML